MHNQTQRRERNLGVSEIGKGVEMKLGWGEEQPHSINRYQATHPVITSSPSSTPLKHLSACRTLLATNMSSLVWHQVPTSLYPSWHGQSDQSSASCTLNSRTRRWSTTSLRDKIRVLWSISIWMWHSIQKVTEFIVLSYDVSRWNSFFRIKNWSLLHWTLFQFFIFFMNFLFHHLVYNLKHYIY